MKGIFSFIALFTFAKEQPQILTQKSQCTGLDIRSELVGPVRDQKQVSWCYSFTAADMLGHTFDLPEQASAADVAINYNDSDIGNIIRSLRERFRLGESEVFMMPHQTGFTKVALDRVMKDGYCPERVFPSESWTKMTRTVDGWEESQSDLKPAMLTIFELLQRKDLNLDNLPVWYQFKNVESPEEFLALLKSSTQLNFYSKLRKEVCQHDRIKFQKRIKTTMYMKDPKIFSVVNKQLEQNNIVGLDYDMRILANRNHRGVKMEEMHTSAIVGRRWDATANECQYLIRDSHGKGCDRYDRSYECLDGQLWMGESQIFPNMTSVVYFNK